MSRLAVYLALCFGTFSTAFAQSPPEAAVGQTVNGCMAIAFNLEPNPVVTTNPLAAVTVHANAPCGYDIRIGTPDGPLFVSAVNDTSTPTGLWVTNGMTFYLQVSGDATAQGTLATATETFQRSTCQVFLFSATPNPIPAFGAGMTTINVDAGCAYDVRVGSSAGTLFLTYSGAVSAQTGDWVTYGLQFYLQPQGDTSPQDTLAVLTVTFQGPPICIATTFAADPNPILTSQTLGFTEIRADASCPYDIRVGGPNGTLFVSAAGPTQTLTGDWVTDGLTFYLQQQGDTTPSGTLANVTVNLHP